MAGTKQNKNRKECEKETETVMPGFTTHIIMGKELVDALDESFFLKKLLSSEGGAYNLGLQGPDVYFYDPLCHVESSTKNIGGIMHEGGTQNYFRVCLSQIRQEKDGRKRDIMVQYLAGFISHYYTDSFCHPFIYSRIGYDAAVPGKNITGCMLI